MMPKSPPIIAIGASAGGIPVLKRLVSLFPSGMQAAVFVVLHASPHFPSQLAEILSEHGPLPAVRVDDEVPLAAGRIYVPPPNHHLLAQSQKAAAVFGPRENRVRPSIDVLFRSAAAYHTSRVAAVLLTGYLDDGVSGLAAVKRCGGVSLVQDPAECEAPELPRTAIAHVDVDHVLPLEGLARQLQAIIHRPAAGPVSVPEDIMEEVRVSEHVVPDLDHMFAIGDLTPYTCPDCGGALWDLKDEPVTRFMCHTGHSFSVKSFLNGQTELIEHSLWSAVRFMQERANILQKLMRSDESRGREYAAAESERKIKEMRHHVTVLRKFIMSGALREVHNHLLPEEPEGAPPP